MSIMRLIRQLRELILNGDVKIKEAIYLKTIAKR